MSAHLDWHSREVPHDVIDADAYFTSYAAGVAGVLDALQREGHVDEIAGTTPLDDDCRRLRREAAA